jgi:hypothetical protein
MTNEELMDIRSRLNLERKAGGADKRWDLNICEGMVREEIAYRIMNGCLSVEVKSDYLVDNSGNIAIEYSCNGKPSGIAATKAEYWWIFLSGKYYYDEVSIVIKTDRLKTIARYWYNMGSVVNGGDNNKAKMVLIPKQELLDLGR